MAADCKFEKLRDFIAKEIGLEIIIESLGWIKSYDFFGSEGYFVNYLRTKDLCNDKYFTNFKCHQCTNTFDTMSKISSIGSVTDNIESSVNRHLIPCKCKSCGSTTAIFERSIRNYPRATTNRIRSDNYGRLFNIQNRPTVYQNGCGPIAGNHWLNYVTPSLLGLRRYPIGPLIARTPNWLGANGSHHTTWENPTKLFHLYPKTLLRHSSQQRTVS